MSSPLTWAIPALSLTGFLIVWLTGSNQELFLAMNSGSNKLGYGEFAKYIWANLTIFGDTLFAFALLSPFARKRPDIIWAILIAAVFATLWVHGLKPMVGHLRPAAVLPDDVIHIIGVTLHKGSFPSGHTTTAFTLAGILCLSRIHIAITITAIILATLAGFSRVMVGAHWPMDIFAGTFGGWIAAVIGLQLYGKLSSHKNWGGLMPNQIPGQKIFNGGLLLIGITLLFHDSGYPSSQPFQTIVAIVCILITVCNLWQLVKTENVK